MYYKVTPSNGQTQGGLNQPESQSSSRADIYRTPEVSRLETLGQIVEWMRSAAVATNNFNHKKVDELGKPDDTIVDGIGKLVFGAKPNQAISALEKTTMMLRAEARLGGEFFGGDQKKKNVTREFFCSDSENWSYFEFTKKTFPAIPFQSNEATLINYRIRGRGIEKIYNDRRGTMTEGETNNLLAAAEGYTDLIGRTLYPELYQHYNDWQDAQTRQQQTVAAQAIIQSNLANSGEFALAA